MDSNAPDPQAAPDPDDQAAQEDERLAALEAGHAYLSHRCTALNAELRRAHRQVAALEQELAGWRQAEQVQTEPGEAAPTAVDPEETAPGA